MERRFITPSRSATLAIIAGFLLISLFAPAQSQISAPVQTRISAQNQEPLTIETCYSLARENYPLIRQQDLITKTQEYAVENVAKGYLPQLVLSGQATYQSDVTQVNSKVNIPGVNVSSLIPKQYKDQYKIYAEADQTVYDGGTLKFQKQSKVASAAVDQQNLEVNLYALRDRVNQLFFGALLLEQQLKQNELQQQDIQNGIDKTQASLNNGTAFRSSLDELKAELLSSQQTHVELMASRKAYLNMLGTFINRPLDENTALVTPPPADLAGGIRRPELTLYDTQKQSYLIQDNILHSNILPKLQFFVQGGYGRPGLNSFKPDFAFYYLGGLRLNWSLGNLYTYKNEKRINANNRSLLDIQKETFLFNTNLTLQQERTDIAKFAAMMERDKEIVALRTSVKNAAAAQLTNGVITAHDYITQVNAAERARQDMVLHQVQLLQSQYNYGFTSGN